MPRDLPSLNAIRIFESAARHLNFSRAADELSVTQGAVSRQIKVLEEQLGMPLFERAGPRLHLTSAGDYYQGKVSEALNLILRSTAELRRSTATPTLTVSVLPTFATKLLVPKIADFQRNNPHIALRMAASYKIIDFATEIDIDAAVRLGRGNWSGVHATRLTASHVFPVCSPRLARSLRKPSDLARHRRLIDDSIYDEWGRWFKAVGAEDKPGETLYIDDDNMLLQAAIDGQGITMSRAIIAQDELDAGRLVRPFDVSVLSTFQYYFVCLPERFVEPDIQALYAWLREALHQASVNNGDIPHYE
jgi:LysR family glycine cleavage system transcriptional activator